MTANLKSLRRHTVLTHTMARYMEDWHSTMDILRGANLPVGHLPQTLAYDSSPPTSSLSIIKYYSSTEYSVQLNTFANLLTCCHKTANGGEFESLLKDAGAFGIVGGGDKENLRRGYGFHLWVNRRIDSTIIYIEGSLDNVQRGSSVGECQNINNTLSQLVVAGSMNQRLEIRIPFKFLPKNPEILEFACIQQLEGAIVRDALQLAMGDQHATNSSCEITIIASQPNEQHKHNTLNTVMTQQPRHSQDAKQQHKHEASLITHRMMVAIGSLS
jgi:hypothetical protein